MPLINCKVELKLKWTMYCVLFAAGADNDANSNIIYTIKETKLYVRVVALSAKDNQNYQNFLANYLKDQFIGLNIKQKVRIKKQNK